ncbi:Oidioi.mRNA.OKI2018_I69.chr2.g7909.t1.cds [Oikopleura dioica]|uniref:Oidioi.mRNA.OKI2018_I69.chr2.g7909.t1.cds n=1 Tax=Oikopleura dioica TaxID=34765 RepID=A0ABN7T887_OIKDI|nr:Oidioi.mRNA.OKI2018_I69.chr2.g7909.t1.cds [Oikopleura dioica]
MSEQDKSQKRKPSIDEDETKAKTTKCDHMKYGLTEDEYEHLQNLAIIGIFEGEDKSVFNNGYPKPDSTDIKMLLKAVYNGLEEFSLKQLGSNFVEFTESGLTLTFDAGNNLDDPDGNVLWEKYSLSGNRFDGKPVKFEGCLRIMSSRRGRLFYECEWEQSEKRCSRRVHS